MRGSQEKLLARSLAFNSRRRPTIIRNSLDSSLQTGVDESLLVGDRAAFRAEFLASGLPTTLELAARTSKNCICESTPSHPRFVPRHNHAEQYCVAPISQANRLSCLASCQGTK